MKLIVNKNRTTTSVGTWGTKNENDYEILEFEFPAELDGYNKRIVYYLGDEKVWDTIVNNKAYITNAITTKGDVKAYVWCTKENTEREADTDFRTMLFDMHFYENENADGIVPTEEQVDGFNTMLTAMNAKIDEVDALETTIGAAEAERQENENTRISNESTRESNESTRQENEQTRQTQEADRERRTDEAIGNIEDKTAEYNANAEAKTNEFNQNATQKTNNFNSNYTQKANDFNTNASSKESAFNSNASSKTSDFNSNAETKTNAFNTNATNKTNAFNSNATEKTTAFDDNASTKTSEFNTNAESKTSEFNSNAESKTTAFNENATSKTNDFNDNATEKTTAYNTNAQNKIDEYDEHIVDYQAQIDELQEEVEELSENMPWNTTEQATEISVDDAAKYSRNKLELFGNTEQDSYEGKNLLNITDIQTDWNGISVVISSGIITLDGTPTTNTTNRNFVTYTATEDGTYTLLPFKSATNANIRLLYSINGGAQQNSDSTPNINLVAGDVLTINLRVSSTDSIIVDFKLKPMLYKGTEATDYEPYVGGVPSPNPDYPQDIHVVTGNNTIEVQGKNLFDKDNYNIKSLNAGGGGKFSSASNQKHIYIQCKPNTDYVVVKNVSNISVLGIYETENKPAVGVAYTPLYFSSNSDGKRHVTTSATAQYLDVRINTDAITQAEIDAIVETLIIAEGTDINMPYQPYYYKDFTIDLGDTELCKIGDYQDYLYKENGNWYKYGAIGKIVADGTENWIKSTKYDGNYYVKNLVTNSDLFNTKMKCNLTKNFLTNDSQLNNYDYACMIDGWPRNLNFKNVDINTIEELKNYLEQNNLILYYVVTAPSTTRITDETLIAQLDAIYEHLKLVKGTNNITVTASDLAPYMKLTYMQDLQSKLDNLDSRLSLLE